MQNKNERYNNNINAGYNDNRYNNNRSSGGQHSGHGRRVRTKYDTGNNFNRRQNFNRRNVTIENVNGIRQTRVQKDNRRDNRGRFNERPTDRYRRNNNNNYDDNDESQWFKVTIPHGVKSGKIALLSDLKSLCDIPFSVFNYQEEGQASIFYVIGKDISDTIKGCSRRLKSPNGFTFTILVSRTSIPFTDVNSEVVLHLKEAMSRRYDTSRRILNLSNLRSDSYLQEQGLFIAVSRPKMLMSVVRIITENIPDIVSLNLSNNKLTSLEPLTPIVNACKLLKNVDLSNNKIANAIPLDYLKGLDMEILLLAGNPLVTQYKTHEDFISSIRSIFPKLLKLDDEVLPPPIKFDVEEAVALPAVMGSLMPDDTKDFILGFINQYFSIYDSDNRQPLVEAYHDQALFSFSLSLLSVHHSKKNQVHFPMNMFQESRNILRVKDRSMQNRLLKRGKEEIVKTMISFPKTKHESESFLIDVNVVNPGLINVVINGVFREFDEKRDRDKRIVHTRAFCRNFLIIPNLIINDLLVLSNATVEQIQKYGKDNSFNNKTSSQTSLLATPQLLPSTSLQASSSLIGGDGIIKDNKETLVQHFSQATGMNSNFSLQCLQEFNFDFNEAVNTFKKLNDSGSIPAEAFQW